MSDCYLRGANPVRSITIGSLNLAGGMGLAELDERFAHLVASIRSASLDILLVQELPHGGSLTRHPAKRLARATSLLEYETFMLSPVSSLEGSESMGVGIFSRFPISNVERSFFRNPNLVGLLRGREINMHDKGMISACVRVDGAALAVCNLHSFPFRLFSGQSAREVDALWQEVAEILICRVPSGSACIVGGDFNSEDRSNLIGRLPGYGFRSAFTGRPTRPNGRSDDDLLISRGLVETKSMIVPVASDHHLVAVEVLAE